MPIKSVKMIDNLRRIRKKVMIPFVVQFFGIVLMYDISAGVYSHVV